MKILDFHTGSCQVLEVSASTTTFSHNRTHHTETVSDISIKIKSDNFIGRLSLNRKEANRLVRLLEKQLVIKKELITQADRNRWAKLKK